MTKDISKRTQSIPETYQPVLEGEVINEKPDLSKPVKSPWVTVLTRAIATNANEAELRDCPAEFMVELKVPGEWLEMAKRLATPKKRDPFDGAYKAFEKNRKKEWTIKIKFGDGDIDLVLEHKATA